MTRRVFMGLSLFILLVASVFALPQGVDFSINFYNKELYYTNSPIFLRASLVNNSNEIYTFRVADKKVFNLGLRIASLENIPLEPSEDFIREKNDNQPVYFREVSLKPNEEFSFVVSLDNFVNLRSSGIYTVQGELYPNLEGEVVLREERISSNTLILFVRPATTPAGMIEASVQERVSRILEKRDISPDEVVTYMLQARQMDEPDKFFLYLDVESLILEDPNYSLAYRTNEAARLSMVNDYRDLLWKGGTMELGRRPSTFEIINTSYTPNSGKVIALVAFDEGNFISYKEYTFYLRKKDLYWMVYNYTVQNSNIQVKTTN